MTATQLEPRQWRLNVPTDRLQESIEKETTLPANVRISLTAEMWLMRVDEFRRLEEEFLESGEYEESLPNHRATLLQLMSEGAQIINVARQHGLSSSISARIEDLEAVQESLGITFQAQHRNKLPESRKAAIASLLGVA